MKRKTKQWPLFLVLWLLLLAACHREGAKEYGEDIGLRVSDPDHLYFKNTRLRHYQAVEDAVAYVTYYRHEKQAMDTFAYQLYLVDNWIRNKAYLLIAQGGDAPLQSRLLTSPLHIMQYEQNSNQLLFTSDEVGDIPALFRLYRALGEGSRLCFSEAVAQPQSCLIAASPAHTAWRETIADFLNLTQLAQRGE